MGVTFLYLLSLLAAGADGFGFMLTDGRLLWLKRIMFLSFIVLRVQFLSHS